MTTVFITGATGLIGSNIAEQLAERGDDVRALVRPDSDAKPLEALGVTIVRGDITDAADVRAAAEGAEVVVHSAAVLGGASQTSGEHEAVNVRGTGYVFDAAADVGARRVVALSTTTFFDVTSSPLSEHSPLSAEPPTDPYSVTKLAAFRDAMGRVEEGQDICIVISGGAYGPSPLPERSMVAPSYNQRICLALLGELHEGLAFPIPWVLAADVARATVEAIELGRPGERYLGFGRPEDVSSVPALCNRAAELAGVEHRVHEIGGDALDDPAVQARFGPSLIQLARRVFPEPWFVADQTRERLGYEATSLDDCLRLTLPWLADNGFLPGVRLEGLA